MKIIHFTIIESIVFLIIAFYLGIFIKSKTDNTNILYLNYLFWLTVIILSVLINFKKYLYFLSACSIIILLTIGLIFKLDMNKYFEENMFYIGILLIAISFIVMINFILSKFFIYSMINTQAPQGDKGKVGEYGKSGQSFFIESLPEKCFQEVYKHLEDSYENIKKSNNIEFNTKDYHINNYFIKDNIKRICYSKEFLDNFYVKKGKNGNVTPECVMKYKNNKVIGRRCNIPNVYGNIDTCNKDSDCYTVENSDLIYQRLVKKIKNQIAGNENSMLELLLRNNCDEDIKARDKLGGPKYLTLEDMYNDPNESYDVNLKYNNKVGHKFLNDHFMNDKYWDNNLTKKINNNPFVNIKKLEVWQWGIPKKKCIK